MKAEELRIGNFVDRNGLMEVKIIHELTIRIYDHYNNVHIAADFKVNSFKGIPLTEEWLKKLGFVRLPNWQDSWMWLANFGMNFHSGSWYWNDLSKSRKIEFVHQLQNLYFALTGTELSLLTSKELTVKE